MAGRALLAALALGAAAWLVLTLRSETLEARAAAVAFSSGRPAAAEIERAVDQARAARRLVPDTSAKLIEWRLLFRSGRRRAADALLLEIVRDEPDNAEVWNGLAKTARDPDVRRRAAERFSQLRSAR